jgi:hypothetical protein
VVAILCGEIAACSFCIHSFSCRVQATPALTSRVLMLHIEYTGRSLFVRPCAPYTNRRTSVSLCFCDPLRASQSLSEPLRASQSPLEVEIEDGKADMHKDNSLSPAAAAQRGSELHPPAALDPRPKALGSREDHPKERASLIPSSIFQGKSPEGAAGVRQGPPVSSRSKRHDVRSADCLTAWRNLPVGVNQHQPLVIASGCV